MEYLSKERIKKIIIPTVKILLSLAISYFILMNYHHVFDFLTTQTASLLKGSDTNTHTPGWSLPIPLQIIGIISFIFLLLISIIGIVRKNNIPQLFTGVVFFFPYATYFVSTMSFLYGLGILFILWFPLWGISDYFLSLGDIIYLPLIVVLPLQDTCFSTFYYEAILSIIFIGLFFLVYGSLTYLSSLIYKNKLVTSGLYRFSRHPQYLGWIILTYGIFIFSISTPVAKENNIEYSTLPFVISTFLILSAAWIEEKKLLEKYNDEYRDYMTKSYFLFPFPRKLSRMLPSPHSTWIPIKKYGLKVLFVCGLYIGVIIILSIIMHKLLHLY